MQDNKIVITIVGVIIIGTGWFQIDQSIKRSFEKGRRDAFEEALGNIEISKLQSAYSFLNDFISFKISFILDFLKISNQLSFTLSIIKYNLIIYI